LNSTTATSRPAEPAVSARAWIALAVLFAIGACSMADRYVLAMLAPYVKRDLHLSDAQIGLLVGPAIAVLYATMGVPLGHWADRLNRVRFLSVCLAIWSVFTGLGGFATNVWQLALSRIGVSAAEGGCAPASFSLLADVFPASRRALSGAIYAASSSLGVLLAFGAGGYIAQHHGWRTALMAAAVPGVLLALVTLAVLREPARGALDGPAAPEASSDAFLHKVRVIFGRAIYRRALLGAGLIHVSISVITAWGPTFLVRKFGATASIVGFSFGMGLALVGSCCVLVSGWVISRIGAQRFGRSLRLVAVLELAAVAFLLTALFAPSFHVAVVALSFLYGFSNLYLPTQFVVVQNYLPANMRATGSAMGSLLVLICAQGIAPPVVGAISDALTPRLGAEGLGLAMLLILPAILLSALAYVAAGRAADVAENARGYTLQADLHSPPPPTS
jgi:MFS family permease